MGYFIESKVISGIAREARTTWDFLKFDGKEHSDVVRGGLAISRYDRR
jgi:hypothetical protein